MTIKNKPETTTVEIPIKTLKYFNKIKENKRLSGMWAFFEWMEEIIKRLKLEKEL